MPHLIPRASWVCVGQAFVSALVVSRIPDVCMRFLLPTFGPFYAQRNATMAYAAAVLGLAIGATDRLNKPGGSFPSNHAAQLLAGILLAGIPAFLHAALPLLLPPVAAPSTAVLCCHVPVWCVLILLGYAHPLACGTQNEGNLLAIFVGSLAGCFIPWPIGGRCVAFATLGLWLELSSTFAIHAQATSPTGSKSNKRRQRASFALVASILVAWLFMFASITTLWTNPRCCSNPSIARQSGRGPPKALMTVGSHRLLSRIESATGFLSVVDDVEIGARFLKCDHSILGGVYLATGDSIFGVFYQHEAVRLVSNVHVHGRRPSALLIGVGIGTVASGLMQHGVRVRALELDPQVLELAKTYFALRQSAGSDLVVGDALQMQDLGNEHYDYVVHDVFTGGDMEPRLFTLEFFQTLSALLQPNGVLAVNFFGAVRGPNVMATQVFLATLLKVFDAVRVFRDEHDDDLANLVFFASHHPIVFRAPHQGKNSCHGNAVGDEVVRRSHHALVWSLPSAGERPAGVHALSSFKQSRSQSQMRGARPFGQQTLRKGDAVTHRAHKTPASLKISTTAKKHASNKRQA